MQGILVMVVFTVGVSPVNLFITERTGSKKTAGTNGLK